jgi:hypothetical protein
MNKEQKIKRKIERRLKNRSKHTKLNIELLRQEILGYQFYFPDQTPWNQSFPVPRDYNYYLIKPKDHQQGSPEIKHED